MPKRVITGFNLTALLFAGLLCLQACSSGDSKTIETIPLQEKIQEETLTLHGWQITKKATYQGKFRILGTETYNWSLGGDIAPVDFAVGWNKMADYSLYSKLNITQSNRWFRWHGLTKELLEQGYTRQDIEHNAANMHMVPADESIAIKLKNVDKHDIVFLSGFLVDIYQPEKKQGMKTSLSRTDTGDGSCEILLVTSLEKINAN